MPRDISETSAFTAPISVPVNGEPVAAETRDPAFQGLTNRTKYLKDYVEPKLGGASGAGEWLYPSARSRTILFAVDDGRAGDFGTGPGWISTTGEFLTSQYDAAAWIVPLGKDLPDGAVVTRIRAMVVPGAVRSAGAEDRMRLSLYSRAMDFGAPSVGAAVEENWQQDGGVTSLHDIQIDQAVTLTKSSKTYWIRLQSGNDGGAHVADTLHGFEITFDDPGPRNF